MSTIEWTDSTWNPVTGCTRASSGCDNCYAATMSWRLENMGQAKYEGLTVLNKSGKRQFNGVVRCHENTLDIPRRWRKSRWVFVNSMSDLFHRDVPVEFIQRVFAVMNDCSQHRFQILTKRPERALELATKLHWTDNILMGTSIENDHVCSRVEPLREIPAKVRFLSLEPLIGPLPSLDLSGIHWVIVGGESGPKSRPMNPVWVRDIRDQCVAAGVSFFFKQWGGVNKKAAGRVLDGQIWDQMPEMEILKE